jgi:hypothetical protein
VGNGRKLNILTSAIIWVLVLLSIILTASVLFPNISTPQIVAILGGGVALGIALGLYLLVQSRRTTTARTAAVIEPIDRSNWRMPSLTKLKTPVMSTQRKVGLMTLRGYLVVAFALVIVKIVEVAVH